MLVRLFVRAVPAALVASILLAAPAAADDLIVRFKPGTPDAVRLTAQTLAGVTRAEALPLSDAFTITAPDGAAALTTLVANPAVLYAERIADIHRFAVPNDRFFPQQWSLPIISAPNAWDVTTGGPQVVVGVIDGGISTTHPDLKPNLWTNAGEKAGNGKDDDRNGYVDDVNGYDFAQHDGSPEDGDGHGSHVAGIIGAQGNDGVGITGLAWHSKLMGLRALLENGDGDIADAIKAYGYAQRAGVRVINVSWGGNEFTRAERDMIAGAPNVLIIASAGNGGKSNDSAPEYPCNHDLANVICVGATDQQDNLAEFSNFGNSVDLAAPGVEIPSTIINGEYSYEDGTSMAAPHVTGTAALMLARAPGATAADLKRAILESVDTLPGLAGKVATGGRLNVAGALGAIGAIAGSAAAVAPPPPPPLPPVDTTRPGVRILSAGPSRDLRRLSGAGMKTKIRCSEACSMAVELIATSGSDRLIIGRKRTSFSKASAKTLTVSLLRSQKSLIRRTSSLRGRLVVRATDHAGNLRTVTKTFRWHR
jgi:subtilisin family serine protease